VGTEAGFYQGSSFVNSFNLTHFFNVLFNYNKAAFPTYIFHESYHFIDRYSILTDGHHQNFWYVLKNSNLVTIISALLQCSLFVFLLKKIKPFITWKNIGLSASIVFIFTFCVHILLAVTEKYQGTPYWRSVSGYISTYYSYFCITLFIGLLVYAGVKLSYKIQWLKNIVIGFFTCLLFYTVIIIGYNNDHLSRAWQRSQNKFTMMDKALEKGFFDGIPEDALIYAKDMTPLDDFGAGFVYPAASKDYLQVKTGNTFNIHTNFANFVQEFQTNQPQYIYLICNYDSPKNSDILLVVSRLNYETITVEDEEKMLNSATSNEAKVFVRRKNEEIKTFDFQSGEPFQINNFSISTIGFFDKQ
jgi:hypothetical protein